MIGSAPTVAGTCDPAFKPVQDAFMENFASRGDVGAAVCLIAGGRTVVDLWGGESSPGRAWSAETLVNVWSATKVVVALAAHMTVDRGQLDLDAPVARYWPEFAAGGKGDIPVRYLLSHRAGLSGASDPITIDDLSDWERVTGLLAGMEPWWEPGTASGYHALTFGYLVGEVIRRADGRSVGRFVREEIAGPLDTDIYIGLPRSEWERVATLSMENPGDTSDVAAMFATLSPAAIAALTNPSMAAPQAAEIANRPEWRSAEIPAANGHLTARALASVYAVLAGGGEHKGIRLLGPESAERVREGQGRGVDLVLGAGMGGGEMEFALGVILSGPESQYGPNPRAFGHDGYGGSFGMADPEGGIALGYVVNHMGVTLAGDPRKVALLDAVYGAL